MLVLNGCYGIQGDMFSTQNWAVWFLNARVDKWNVGGEIHIIFLNMNKS